MHFDIKKLQQRMQMVFDKFKTEILSMRGGAVNTAILTPLRVKAYGNNMPVTQLASVSILDARTLSMQVWDKSVVNNVVKAILESDLGLNPVVEGQILKIPVPQLSEERRKEIFKICAKYAEQAKIAVRNVRKDGMDELKKSEKNKEITVDEKKNYADKLQQITDEVVKNINKAIELKEKEIMKI